MARRFPIKKPSIKQNIEHMDALTKLYSVNKEPTKSKMLNRKTIVDGIEFSSKKEAARYLDLKAMERCGDILNLRRQTSFLLIPKQESDYRKEREIRYIADFTYDKNGKFVVEDVKGQKFGQAYALFVIKRKLMLWEHGVSVIEI